MTNDSVLFIPEDAEIRNGSMLLKFSPDYYPAKIKKNRLVPITDVKQVSYKNHWKAMVPGFAMGLLIGGLIGATGLVFNFKEGGNHPKTDYGSNIWLGSLNGIIIGTVVGFIVGFNEIYQFSQ